MVPVYGIYYIFYTTILHLIASVTVMRNELYYDLSSIIQTELIISVRGGQTKIDGFRSMAVIRSDGQTGNLDISK